MMKTAVVLFAPGFEESEALTVVDILRRGAVDAKAVSVGEPDVTGAHGITLRADCTLDDLTTLPDLIVLPGGYAAVGALRQNPRVRTLLCEAAAADRCLAALCAAPVVLSDAGLLENRRFTAYPTVAATISAGHFCAESVVCDGKLVTGMGPAAVYAFSYALLEQLGADRAAVESRMVYSHSFDPSRAVPLPNALPAADAETRQERIAVLMAEGFEEGETMTIVDLLRRLGFCCDTFYFGAPLVRGMHGMMLYGDRPFGADVSAYDVVVLPGGRPGGENLRRNPDVTALLRTMNDMPGKYLAAMCSGTTVLAAAEVIAGKRMTGYTGYAEKLPGALFSETVAVKDQNLITSQGPATPYPFALLIAETLGANTAWLRARTLYPQAGGIG